MAQESYLPAKSGFKVKKKTKLFLKCSSKILIWVAQQVQKGESGRDLSAIQLECFHLLAFQINEALRSADGLVFKLPVDHRILLFLLCSVKNPTSSSSEWLTGKWHLKNDPVINVQSSVQKRSHFYSPNLHYCLSFQSEKTSSFAFFLCQAVE